MCLDGGLTRREIPRPARCARSPHGFACVRVFGRKKPVSALCPVLSPKQFFAGQPANGRHFPPPVCLPWRSANETRQLATFRYPSA